MPTLPRAQAQALLPWTLVAIGFAAVAPAPAVAAGWAVVAVGLVLYVLGRSQDILLFEIGSLLWLVTGTLLLFRGPAALKAL